MEKRRRKIIHWAIKAYTKMEVSKRKRKIVNCLIKKIAQREVCEGKEIVHGMIKQCSSFQMCESEREKVDFMSKAIT